MLLSRVAGLHQGNAIEVIGRSIGALTPDSASPRPSMNSPPTPSHAFFKQLTLHVRLISTLLAAAWETKPTMPTVTMAAAVILYI
jgi:hypothetical protein